METVVCDFCGADQTSILYSGTDLDEPILKDSAIVRCAQCGLMYLNPRPSEAEIGFFYPPDYRNYQGAIEDEKFAIMRWMRNKKMAQRREKIEKYSGLTSGRILDVGCSTGLFLNEMQKSGWSAQGIEPTPSAAQYAKNRFHLEIFQGFLAEADYEPASFDVITFWDVLEHSFSPRRDLQKTAQLLRPGGLVAINVPNWHSPDRMLFGPNWIGLDPPRHLYIFTRKTLTLLLKQAGLVPLAWVCFMPGYFSFIISIERWLNAKAPRLTKPVSQFLNFPGMRLIFQPYFSLANLTGHGGVISVFARNAKQE